MLLYTFQISLFGDIISSVIEIMMGYSSSYTTAATIVNLYSQTVVKLESWTIDRRFSLSFASVIAMFKCVSPLIVSVSLVDMLFLVFH